MALAKCRKQLVILEKDLESLLIALESTGENLASIQGQLTATLSLAGQYLAQGEDMAQKELVSDKRSLMKSEVRELQADLSRLKAEYQKLKYLQTQKVQSQKKSELFYQPATTSAGNPYHRPSNSYDQVSTTMDHYLNLGMATLKDLQSQHSLFKGVQKRLLHAANTLGLSQRVIRWIERRSSQDKWIFYTGILVTLFLLILIYRYL